MIVLMYVLCMGLQRNKKCEKKKSQSLRKD